MNNKIFKLQKGGFLGKNNPVIGGIFGQGLFGADRGTYNYANTGHRATSYDGIQYIPQAQQPNITPQLLQAYNSKYNLKSEYDPEKDKLDVAKYATDFKMHAGAKQAWLQGEARAAEKELSDFISLYKYDPDFKQKIATKVTELDRKLRESAIQRVRNFEQNEKLMQTNAEKFGGEAYLRNGNFVMALTDDKGNIIETKDSNQLTEQDYQKGNWSVVNTSPFQQYYEQEGSRKGLEQIQGQQYTFEDANKAINEMMKAGSTKTQTVSDLSGAIQKQQIDERFAMVGREYGKSTNLKESNIRQVSEARDALLQNLPPEITYPLMRQYAAKAAKESVADKQMVLVGQRKTGDTVEQVPLNVPVDKEGKPIFLTDGKNILYDDKGNPKLDPRYSSLQEALNNVPMRAKNHVEIQEEVNRKIAGFVTAHANQRYTTADINDMERTGSFNLLDNLDLWKFQYQQGRDSKEEAAKIGEHDRALFGAEDPTVKKLDSETFFSQYFGNNKPEMTINKGLNWRVAYAQGEEVEEVTKGVKLSDSKILRQRIDNTKIYDTDGKLVSYKSGDTKERMEKFIPMTESGGTGYASVFVDKQGNIVNNELPVRKLKEIETYYKQGKPQLAKNAEKQFNDLYTKKEVVAITGAFYDYKSPNARPYDVDKVPQDRQKAQKVAQKELASRGVDYMSPSYTSKNTPNEEELIKIAKGDALTDKEKRLINTKMSDAVFMAQAAQQGTGTAAEKNNTKLALNTPQNIEVFGQTQQGVPVRKEGGKLQQGGTIPSQDDFELFDISIEDLY